MNQKLKTLILWALPILLVIVLSYQFLSSSNVDSLKSNGTTIAPRNSAVARVSYGRFLDYIKLKVKLNFHEQIAEISDLRGSQPQLTVLFKNLYTAESIETSKNAMSVTIVNGPVDSGFNGEIVALFMTLSSFDEINVGSLKLTHSGTNIIGYYEDTEILFGSPIDLATKAASIGELLSYGNCEGTVRFITNNSFVTDCKI